MYKLVISNSHNVYYNLALESYLLSLKEEIIFLWVNSPTIVIGYNQNCYKETDLDYLKDNNINIARRISGGGCVYHDLNNLNVSLLTAKEDPSKLNNILKDVLKLYDIHSVITTSNDLLINDLKFSGQASYQENTACLYHSCVLVDVDLNVLSKAITPSKLKLKTHAIDSVRKRVVNLRSINPNITIKSMIENFKKLDYLDLVDLKIDENKVNKIKELYSSHDYIFGNNPKFTYNQEHLINNDIFDILLEVEENRVKNFKICTDASTVFDFKPIYQKYLNKEFDLNNTINQIILDIKNLY